METDKNLLLEILPELVWEQVIRYLTISFQLLQSCSEVSDYFETLIQRIGHLVVVGKDKILSSNYHEQIDCVPKSTGLILFPEPILAKPQITAMNICMTPNFRPITDYLKWLIISQRDSLETLHISCLGIKKYPVILKLPEMGKLRNLQIVRNVILDEKKRRMFSLDFFETPLLPVLESLTLSAFGAYDDWKDFLVSSNGSKETKCPSCPTVQHLRLLRSRPKYIWWTSSYLSNFVFPNLVSLEIPAVQLSVIYWMFPAPKNLKRLTLTLPTRGLHKHLFDVSITGYGEQVCASLLANPDADPLKIRAEFEEENEGRLDDFEEWEREVMKSDNEFRRQGIRVCNLTYFTGLEELRIKSDTGDWGPTLVSCPDLLSMRSLKNLEFCGHKPKYIPDDMMRKLRERFTVKTPGLDDAVDSISKISPLKPTFLNVLLEGFWRSVFRCLGFSFQTLESCLEASNVFEDPNEKPGVLSITRRILRPENFRQWLYSHSGLPPPLPQILPRIKTFDISINSNFQPLGYHLNSLLESQRDSLEKLHISCLGLKMDYLEIELPGMNKLRDLQIIRNVKTKQGAVSSSIEFVQSPVVPVLETLTLSTFGWGERWDDFLQKPDGSLDPEYPTCATVTHLRLLPSRQTHLLFMLFWIKLKNIVFPNLVSLEIPALLLELFYTLPSTPDSLKRLTLTLPTRGLHKHLFDACITGYGEQVCAAILADPNRDPAQIREEIEDENIQQVDLENQDPEYILVRCRLQRDNFYRRQGLRCPNITNFLGLEELWIKSDTGDWGPTVVSCPDLLTMESLKTLRFCGHKPKYILDDMINEMKERFTVLLD